MIPSAARRGLDLLLAHHPSFDVLEVNWQRPEEGPWPDGLEDPWLLVVLGQRSEGGREIWARHHFAIWKTTGAVHGRTAGGAVTDDPLLAPVVMPDG